MDIWCFVFGVCVGGLFAYAMTLVQAARGSLIVDFSDPNKDIFRFELDNFDDLYEKDIVMCRVVRIMEKDTQE